MKMKVLAPSILLGSSLLFSQTLCINSGGPALPPVNPGDCAFTADQGAIAGSYTWGPGSVGYMPLPPGIWSDIRYGQSFAYNLPLANGLYKVEVYTEEPTQNGPNLRKFVINANGVQSDPLDVWALTGGIGIPYTVILDQVPVTNGNLRIGFVASVMSHNGIGRDSAVVAGFKITPLPPPPPPPINISQLTAPPGSISLLYTDAQGHVLQGTIPGLSVDANGAITFVAQLTTPKTSVTTVAVDTPNSFPIPDGCKYAFIARSGAPPTPAKTWFAVVDRAVVLDPPSQPGDIVQMMCF